MDSNNDKLEDKIDELNTIETEDDPHFSLRMDTSDSETITTSQLNFEEFMSENNEIMSPSKLTSSEKPITKPNIQAENKSEEISANTTSEEIKTTTPDEIRFSTLEEIKISAPEEIKTSTPEERKASIPEEIKTFTSEEINISTAEEINISTAEEIKNTTSVEIKTSTPEEIKTSTPEEIKTSTSEEIKSSTSEEIKTSTSEEIKTSTSEEIKTSTSEEIKTSTSEEIKTSTSEEIKCSTSEEIKSSKSELSSEDTEPTTSTTNANNSKIDTITDKSSKPTIATLTTAKVPGSVTTQVIKFPPKATIAKNAAGQYVLIQPNGKVQPVRLAKNPIKTNTESPTTSNPITPSAKPMTIQVIRTADGNLVPLKGNNTKTINLNKINITGKKLIVKSGTGLITPGATNSPKILNTSAPVSTSTTTAPKILNSGASASALATSKSITTIPTPSTSSTTPKILNTTVAPKILNSQMMKTLSISSIGNNSNKIILNKEVDGSKRFTTSQTLVKIASSGTLTKVGTSSVSAGGGGKFKYVRILNPGVASSSSIDGPKPQKFILKPTVTIKTELKQEKEDNVVINTETIKEEPTQSKIINPTKILNKILPTRNPPKILNNLIPLNGQQRIIASKGQFLLSSPNKDGSRDVKPINRMSSYGTIKIEDDDKILRQNVNSLLKSTMNKQNEKNDLGSVTITQELRRLSPQPIPIPIPEPADSTLRRKHCNCTKSQCLKLYCDCFANGEFCQDCNCKECFNNLEYEDERQKAIKICLERNSAAFKPKITKAKDQTDLRLHNKGCNCKRSGCLKNYCECYEAKIACSTNCKCMGCRNVEDRRDLTLVDVAERIANKNFTRTTQKRPHDEIEKSSQPGKFTGIGLNQRSQSPPPVNKPYNFITQDVVDATIQCMVAQADECQKSEIPTKATERMILEELGRCLVEIIDFSIRNIDN